MTNKDIGIYELIELVKNELTQQSNTDPMFAVRDIELNISYTVERGADGKVDFKVIQGGADRRDTRVQHVRVTLVPLVTVDEMRERLSNIDRNRVARGFSKSVDLDELKARYGLPTQDVDDEEK